VASALSAAERFWPSTADSPYDRAGGAGLARRIRVDATST
jgi:hypothetical protein